MSEMSDQDGLVTVVVPVWVVRPSAEEEMVLRNLFRVLGRYPIGLLAPQSLSTSWYHLVAAEEDCAGCYDERFADHCFRGIHDYSRLLLRREFYERFARFRYMLIHQLDAYVFRDELQEWCAKGFDYIGAPWFPEFTRSPGPEAQPWRVGNGGFSLRRIEAHLRIFRWRRQWPLSELYRRERQNGRKALLRRLPWLAAAALGYENNSRYRLQHYPEVEDRFWAEEAHQFDPRFQVAPVRDALAFAFEVAPERCYALNGRRLPFGCHAWQKHNPLFWKRHLPVSP